jgi:hypothetical protein
VLHVLKKRLNQTGRQAHKTTKKPTRDFGKIMKLVKGGEDGTDKASMETDTSGRQQKTLMAYKCDTQSEATTQLFLHYAFFS